MSLGSNDSDSANTNKLYYVRAQYPTGSSSYPTSNFGTQGLANYNYILLPGMGVSVYLITEYRLFDPCSNPKKQTEIDRECQ